MAGQEPSSNQVADIARVLQRRAGQIVVPAAVVLALGVSLARLMPQKYTATTGIELRETTLPIGGQGFDEKTIQRDVTSTGWQITGFERVRRVIDKLEWPEYVQLSEMAKPEFVRDEIKQIVVSVQPAKNLQGSSLIRVGYTNADPQRAEQFLNRLRDAYISEVLDRFRNDAKRSLELLRNQMTLAADQAHDRDEEAAKYKKDYGISATQQAPGGGRQRDEDPVFTRLTQAGVRLSDTESQIAADSAGLAALKEQLADEPPEIPSAPASFGGLSFDDELEKIEKEIENLRDSQRGYTDKHSTYVGAELKIRKLTQKAAALREKATAPQLQETMKPNPRREALLTQIQQKELALKQAEGLKRQLEKEIEELRAENARRVEIYRQIQELDRKAQVAADDFARISATYLRQKSFVDIINEGVSNPFEVTEQARAPTVPSSPSSGIVTAAAAVLGLGIGLIWALASEFGRNGFRGAADATRGLAIPVLGVVNRILTRSERRSIAVRRAVVAASTGALVAAILWVSWAYDNRPQVLGPDLERAITKLKEKLR